MTSESVQTGFGQTFPDGRCAVWRTGFVNQSDTAIDQITMAPPGGDYTGEWNGHNSPTRPAVKPTPAVLNVYIAPGKSAAFEYKTCTSTPSPGPRFAYGPIPSQPSIVQTRSGHRRT